MKLFLRLTAVFATVLLVLTIMLLSIKFIPLTSQPVYAWDSVSKGSDLPMEQHQVITFTPVATIFLPIIVNGEVISSPTPTPGAANVKISHILYNPDGSDADGEYVELHNLGTVVADLTNWTLRDAKDTTYTFPTLSLASGAKVKIWAKSGSNTTTDLYWSRNSAIWNNDGDTATLRNAEGADVDTCTYTGGAISTNCE